MAIYRGPGGSGDATQDAASEVLLAVQAKNDAVTAQVAAEAAQAAAEAAQAAAELAETNAEIAETNAETAETNAETAATNAASSASAASTSASNAASSATNAANSATAAQTAETNAETAETNAAASASAAATSASNAATSASNAANSASAASTSATNASNSASAAATSATNAANSATAAQTAETNAETAETNASASASAAATSASNAASSASAASTSASNAASSASAAATSASNAASSATSASNSATTATTQATNASNSASAALTSENNAASSASAAATSASNAATSATSASNSASAASTSETNAANSASAASTSATNAANSASAASTSASNAATSESNAATSASNAANSASAAATSASNAATSASNAASSASAAAASYDSFDDRYLGAKSSVPTLDNDGNTLLVGALYFDTVSNFMKVWDGSSWLDAYASLSGALLAANNLSDLTNAATARDNLGVEIGVDVQAYDAQLADIAGLTPADNNFIVGNGTNFVTESGSTARTSLGLGSIATQDANNVAVTGGSINGTTVGASTPSTGSFTSLTDSGNLTFTGTGNRITGDFSNATLSNRVAFQTSTTNGNSVVSVLPNGTANIASYDVFNTSDPTNSVRARFGVSATALSIESSISGTGSYVPMIFQTGGSERLRIDTSGNVGIGTSSPTAKLHTFSTTGAPLTLDVSSGNATNLIFSQSGSAKWFIRNLDTANAFSFYDNTAGAERMRIDSSGNVGIGTSSPNANLHLGDQGASVRIGITASDQYGQLSRDIPTGNIILNAAQSGTNLTFQTVSTERMRITSGGNVGIGTSSPSTALHVNGTITTSGAITANGNNNYSYQFGHGNWSRVILPAGNNGAGSGEAGLYSWISEPAVTWTGAGIARNRYNLNASFPRPNTSLTGQMIRFGEGTDIYFNTQNTSGTNFTPLSLIDNNATIAGTCTASSFVGSGVARAWVYFNGGSASIMGSYNVGSVTRNSGGQYTINFTSNLPNGNYAAAGMTYDNGNNGRCLAYDNTYRGNAVNGLGVTVVDFGYNRFDANRISVVVFG